MSQTKDLITLRKCNSIKLSELVEKLNVEMSGSNSVPLKSIMHFSQLCECDDGYLCEHRLQFIVDFFLNNP